MTEETGDRPVLEATVDRLRAEIEGLRAAMRTRGVIEMAKGVLVARLNCTPDEAFARLAADSQRQNRRLTAVAADLLGVAAPPEAPADPHRAAPTPPLRIEAEHPHAAARDRTSAPSPQVQAYAGRFHLAASALAAAETPDDLARALHEVALEPIGVGAVVLALLEPDGALRLTGSHGVSAHQLSQWQRIPPQTAVPLTEAAHLGTVVWVHDRTEFAARYPDLGGEDLIPGRTVCALPLRSGHRISGAMKLGWPQEYRPDPAAAQYLATLARLVAAELPRVVDIGRQELGLLESASEPWFRAVLDAVLDPVLILSTVREADGTVADLLVEHANAATLDLAGRTGKDLVGRRLTELYPGMVASGVFRRLVDVAAGGIPSEGVNEQYVERVRGSLRATAMTLNAVPFLDGVLISWHAHDEQELRAHHLAQAERLARVGTWTWQPGDEGITCSTETLRLLGLADRPAGPVDAARLLAAAAPADRPALRAAAEHLLTGRNGPIGLEFEVPLDDGYRNLRALAEANTATGGVVAVNGVVQDVTPWRRAEQALAGARDQLAAQRLRTDEERHVVEALQRALMAAPTGPPPAGLETATRYLPAAHGGKVGGDWYDIVELPDGTVLLAVGDVSGHGIRAAAGMARLRHALRGIAQNGGDPGQMLGGLNRMLCHERADFIATVLCGRLDPRTGRLQWARAGHLPPVLTTPGAAARALAPPEGLVLGVVPAARYATAETTLAPGQTLLLYTDGLVERRGSDLGAGVARLLGAVDEYRAPDLEGCLDHVVRRLGAPNPLDDACLVGLRLRDVGPRLHDAEDGPPT
ncbi:SpoIIE family protein phosphatase [Kitasatospora sp. NPDC048365]|uniref:SpoIIE family protein phosphatase n=1 Tax=Kitasatospora sp. NPDC048365 TaxID=3364050 RepID=UPI0037133BFA